MCIVRSEPSSLDSDRLLLSCCMMFQCWVYSYQCHKVTINAYIACRDPQSQHCCDAFNAVCRGQGL